MPIGPSVKKNIYSLTALAHILLGCNRRYLEYLSSLDDFSAGIRAFDRLTQPRPFNGRTLRGLNFFSRGELIQRAAAVEFPRVMGNGLDAKDTFAFAIDLQGQLAAVQLEDRQILGRSLDGHFALGRALGSATSW